jgi:hypothetical protein
MLRSSLMNPMNIKHDKIIFEHIYNQHLDNSKCTHVMSKNYMLKYVEILLRFTNKTNKNKCKKQD